MKRVIVFCAAAALAVGNLGAAELKQGDPAPTFSMEGTDGKTVTNETFKGKKAVVIAWYPKAFTGGCTKECKAMREQGEAIKAYDVAYYTASVDDVQKNKDFAASLSLDYPILSDPSKNAATAFGVLNPERGVTNRWTFYIGKDGNILAIDKMVKTETHGSDIAARLGELGVTKK